VVVVVVVCIDDCLVFKNLLDHPHLSDGYQV